MSEPSCRSKSVLLGLIGSGIQRSRTPALHEAEGRAHGLALVYKIIDLDVLGLGAGDLPTLLTAARRLGFDGLNITHPCKQAVVPLLDEASEDVRILGAANTVVLRGGRAVGHNTDGPGFADAFRREMTGCRLNRVLLVGAGGAGAAVGHALLVLGARELIVADAAAERSHALAALLARRFGADRASATVDLAAALAGADGLVNATPVGMAGHPGLPVPAALLRPELWVADIVYVPLDTALLREARARGCRTMGGGGMAVFQAAHAFRLFTGEPANAERMLAHFARS